MKSIELHDAGDTLRAYASALANEPIIVTKRGKAVAALIRIRDADIESLRVGFSARFQAIVHKSEAEYLRTGGLSEAELKRRLQAPADRPQPRGPVSSSRARKTSRKARAGGA